MRSLDLRASLVNSGNKKYQIAYFEIGCCFRYCCLLLLVISNRIKVCLLFYENNSNVNEYVQMYIIYRTRVVVVMQII